MPHRIFKLLKDSDGKAVPGPEFSRALGITRAAVWKKIRLLRAEGFQIEASREGYRLSGGPELCNRQLGYHMPGIKIVFKENMPSTNDLALLMAMDKAAPPLREKLLSALVVAGSQTAGKGRLGRAWLSPPGVNVYMSAAMRPGLPPRKAPLLALAAGLASVLAIKGQTGLDVRLKWPNDIIVREGKNKKPGAASGIKKLGGILVELRSDPDRVLFAAVGIGINANMKKADIPRELRARATSIFAETGKPVDRAALIASVYRELDYWGGMLNKGVEAGTEQRPVERKLLGAYRNLCDTIGRQISVHSEGKPFTGTATGIDDDGRLILRTAGSTLRFSTGDVSSVRDDGGSVRGGGSL
ncbi:MAG: biotin--[acetyl-CoA-carboxylase] ligase [Nitrospiraceae bacterium]|nr:biotin--[acetyl-CoA-carboxylase] ligase [Nitrospiraceae bacterium]